MDVFKRFGIILYLVIGIFGLFCIYDCFKILNIKNVVLGYFQTNSGVKTISDEEIEITNLLWTNSGDDENTYFAKIPLNAMSGFDTSKKWTILVNDSETYRVLGDYNFVHSIFVCEFFDIQSKSMLKDYLDIKVNFFRDEKVFILTTKNGEKAINLWSSYIQKNGMKIRIVEFEEIESKIQVYNGEKKFVEFYVDDSLYSTLQYDGLSGGIVEAPQYINGKKVLSWVDENGNAYIMKEENNKFYLQGLNDAPKTLKLYSIFTTVVSDVTLTKTAFKNFFNTSDKKKSVSKMIFDYYSTPNKYIVNGVNVISGLSPTKLDDENLIDLYVNGNDYYILSNHNIILEDLYEFFFNFSNMYSITFNNFNTRNVTCMENLFFGCSNLISLNLSSFNTSNVNNMKYMFADCSSLTSLNLSSFDTSNVSLMGHMFSGCSNLSGLDLSSFNTSKVTNFALAFQGCSSLISLDLSSFNTSKVDVYYGMFSSCFNLKTIYVSENFYSDNITSDTLRNLVFSKCYNLVGAISYDENKTSVDYANYETGYFTYKAKSY